MFDPRASTASLVDVGTVRGRVAQPPFDERRQFVFRARDRARELHPPMKFASKSDLERAGDTFAADTPNDSGAWEEPGRLSYRASAPNKWQGGNFRATSAPASNTFASLDGSRYGLSALASEPAVISQDSVHMVLDKALELRARDRRGDLAGDFRTVTRVGARESAAPRRVPFEFSPQRPAPAPRPYAKSLTEAPSVLPW